MAAARASLQQRTLKRLCCLKPGQPCLWWAGGRVHVGGIARCPDRLMRCPATPQPPIPLQSHPWEHGETRAWGGNPILSASGVSLCRDPTGPFLFLTGCLGRDRCCSQTCLPMSGDLVPQPSGWTSCSPAYRGGQGVGSSPLPGNSISPLKPKAISLGSTLPGTGWRQDRHLLPTSCLTCQGRRERRSQHLLHGTVVSAMLLSYFRFSSISAPTV